MVKDPKSLYIQNISSFPFSSFTILNHPEDSSKGLREIQVQKKWSIENKDFEELVVGDLIRLMHFANIKICKKDKETIEVAFVSKEYDKNLCYKKTIHYLLEDPNYSEPCCIIMPDNSKIFGRCELLENIPLGTALQFERFGFVRFDREDPDLKCKVFYYTQR